MHLGECRIEIFQSLTQGGVQGIDRAVSQCGGVFLDAIDGQLYGSLADQFTSPFLNDDAKVLELEEPF